ncbi:DUF2185 domain-containing protein [Chitinophaga sedimenti]|uniref:immunity protein Imm33 domain-containing protein n=1 Tax=Chitinophaga sedimenti TaxID=2033606 RepID=UPI0020042559|nr:DUF2185 domain-containing protein [Chitinophaga sedimenti]MCK7558447.1 DUF2185 domain-containing protein [Chitinophaga sedimenti]
MYREKRSRPEDSGWRIFTGFETEEYNNDSDNIIVCTPAAIMEVDPSLKTLLQSGVGSVWERNEQNEWCRVTDFQLESDYMVVHKLTDDWNIHINNLFERNIEESGNLMYTTGDKTVRLTLWIDDVKNKAALLEEYKDIVYNRDQSQVKTLQTFDFSDDEVARIGYLIEETDGKKNYGVVYGFLIVDHEVLLASLYYDDPEDFNWAIDTWKRIHLNKKVPGKHPELCKQ